MEIVICYQLIRLLKAINSLVALVDVHGTVEEIMGKVQSYIDIDMLISKMKQYP